jgi:hypothetical protein
MRSAILWIFVGILGPCYAAKKPAEPTAPTQADIVKDCIEVRNITFVHAHGFFDASHVSGSIKNTCAHDGQVTVIVAFYNSQGVLVDNEDKPVIVHPNTVIPFVLFPQRGDAAIGKVTFVYWSELP